MEFDLVLILKKFLSILGINQQIKVKLTTVPAANQHHTISRFQERYVDMMLRMWFNSLSKASIDYSNLMEKLGF